jgi:hypothetical protein
MVNLVALKAGIAKVAFGVLCFLRELRGIRVASATTSSLRDRLWRPARAVLAGGYPSQPICLHAYGRYELQITRRCYLLNARSPAPVPDADSIPAQS